jgi:biopolymer transport protein ExbB
MKLSAGLARTRLTTGILCALVALLLGLASPWTSKASAQDEKPAGDNAGEKKEDTSKSTTTTTSDDEELLITHMIKSVGWVFGPLLIFVSVTLIAIIVLLAMDLRMGAAVPPGFVEDFSDVVNKRQFKAAYDLARNDGSYLGRVMTTGMSRLQYGIEDAREASFNMVDSIKASKEQLIAYLATIGTLGPLLGLVGTVFGMILAFRRLGNATHIDTTVAKGLAGDISHALVVTLIGVALSCPAIFFHTFFRNRLIRLSMDTGNVADDLLTQMYHNSKKPALVPERAVGIPEAIPDNRASVPQAIKPK